jgi:MFS family permease
MLMFALAYLDRQIISLMVEPIRHEFGVGDFQVSLLQGFAFALLYAVCGLPLGMAVDRYRRNYVILGGVLIWSLATISCGLARTFNELFLARALVGAGEAALAPAAYSLISDLFPPRKLTFAFGVYMVGALIGAEASLALGGYILDEARDGVILPLIGHVSAWRFAFLVAGLPGLILAFLALLLHEPKRVRGHGDDAGWGAVAVFLSTRKLFFTVQTVGFALVLGLAYARAAWAPTFFMRTFGWTVSEASYALATFGLLTGLVGLVLGGRLVDAWFARGVSDAHFRYYVIGGMVIAAGGVLGFTASSPTLFFIALILPAFALNMGAIGAAACQVATPQHMRGRVSAIYLLITSLVGMSLGPASVGFLSDHVLGNKDQIGSALAIVFGMLGPLVALLFWVGLRPMRKAVASAAKY